MFDIKWIRNNSETFDSCLEARGLDSASQELIRLDQKLRSAQASLQKMQEQRNAHSRAIGAAKSKGEESLDLIKKMREVKQEMSLIEEACRKYDHELHQSLAKFPNMPADDVPIGKDDSSNIEIRRWGEKKSIEYPPREHYSLGEKLGLMDFAGAAKLSGSRFVILSGALAKLERVLAAFMLDLHTNKHDYAEIAPPFLVRENAAFGTGNLPKFADDLFRTEEGYWLIPTAEMPLTNIIADDIVDSSKLPLRFVAYTPCFRAEAGAAGRDTRGMIRQHQFGKVELVSIVHPDASEDEHERMTLCAEEVLKQLCLPYRTVLLSTGDMGFSAKKTYDIEVWLPGQDMYREISSCSNCGNFQGRRMNGRYKTAGSKGTDFVHTLNGSGVAVGRALIAVLENYQNRDGSITIPEVLRSRMGGLETIR